MHTYPRRLVAFRVSAICHGSTVSLLILTCTLGLDRGIIPTVSVSVPWNRVGILNPNMFNTMTASRVNVGATVPKAPSGAEINSNAAPIQQGPILKQPVKIHESLLIQVLPPTFKWAFQRGPVTSSHHLPPHSCANPGLDLSQAACPFAVDGEKACYVAQVPDSISQSDMMALGWTWPVSYSPRPSGRVDAGAKD